MGIVDKLHKRFENRIFIYLEYWSKKHKKISNRFEYIRVPAADVRYAHFLKNGDMKKGSHSLGKMCERRAF